MLLPRDSTCARGAISSAMSTGEWHIHYAICENLGHVTAALHASLQDAEWSGRRHVVTHLIRRSADVVNTW